MHRWLMLPQLAYPCACHQRDPETILSGCPAAVLPLCPASAIVLHEWPLCIHQAVKLGGLAGRLMIPSADCMALAALLYHPPRA